VIDLPLLYADTHYVVLNKPAGLKVHAGPGGGQSVEDFLPTLSKRRDGPWLVHRLDADTSGCLLVALRKQALITAQTAFAEGRVSKTYWAVVEGDPAEDVGEISAPLAKITDGRGWRMAVRRDGQAAVTLWQVLGRGDGRTWLALTPKTGRTHQLRVHCAHMGWPIVGDALYGAAGDGLHLLSRSLALPDSPVKAEASPPTHMRAALGACGFESS
jgi:tRNA pseudouridine32 synthase/23S rRNA pseudouridine746 synthase